MYELDARLQYELEWKISYTYTCITWLAQVMLLFARASINYWCFR
jgi:hypothetical protein